MIPLLDAAAFGTGAALLHVSCIEPFTDDYSTDGLVMRTLIAFVGATLVRLAF